MNFKTIGLREELRNCRPTVHVESPGAAFADVLVEFAIGPRGQERIVLRVPRPGVFQFPEVIETGQRVSARIPAGIPVTFSFSPPAAPAG
jgi:hypothetical protein